VSTQTFLKKEPIIVHYLNSAQTATLCGIPKKLSGGGPMWVIPKALGSKKDVNCATCIETQQKALT
jgi:hypothetical protein